MSNKIHSKKPALLASLACGASLLLVANTLFADRIAAGDTHNLTAAGNGDQFVWGGNANGQLGDGTTLDALNPIAVVDIRYQALNGAIAVVTHGDNNLVLLDDATLLGWGPNESLQLGNGLLYSGKYLGVSEEDTDDTDDGTDPEPASTALAYPTEVVDPDGKPVANITAISLGANFAAAVNQEGNVLVWGNLETFKDREEDREPANRYRDKFFDPSIEFIDSKYKDGDPADFDYELRYMSDEQGSRYAGIIAVAVGDSHLLALTDNGQVLAWGENSAGQLGDGTLTQRAYPVYVRSSQSEIISAISSIAARGDASLAVQASGQLLGWGSQSMLKESPDRLQQYYARSVVDEEGNAIAGIQRVVPGDSHTLALMLDNTVLSWGSNSNGQLGDGTNASVSGTTKVVLFDGQQLNNIVEVGLGSTHSIALRRDGHVYAWGSGDNGRLGDGTNIDSYYAVNVRDRNNSSFDLF